MEHNNAIILEIPCNFIFGVALQEKGGEVAGVGTAFFSLPDVQSSLSVSFPFSSSPIHSVCYLESGFPVTVGSIESFHFPALARLQRLWAVQGRT